MLGGIYAGNVPGITAQHLEWVSLFLPHNFLYAHENKHALALTPIYQEHGMITSHLSVQNLSRVFWIKVSRLPLGFHIIDYGI